MKGLIFSLAVLTSISFVAKSKSQQSSGNSSNVNSTQRRLSQPLNPVDLYTLRPVIINKFAVHSEARSILLIQK